MPPGVGASDYHRSERHGPGPQGGEILLAWWNAEECGGFDLTDLWNVDVNIAVDMVAVFAFVANQRHYPDDLGYKEQFQAVSMDPPDMVSTRGDSQIQGKCIYCSIYCS